MPTDESPMRGLTPRRPVAGVARVPESRSRTMPVARPAPAVTNPTVDTAAQSFAARMSPALSWGHALSASHDLLRAEDFDATFAAPTRPAPSPGHPRRTRRRPGPSRAKRPRRSPRMRWRRRVWRVPSRADPGGGRGSRSPSRLPPTSFGPCSSGSRARSPGPRVDLGWCSCRYRRQPPAWARRRL